MDRETDRPASHTYDHIGQDYAARRRPDPRWAARIHAAVAGCRTLVNVGAGTGSYEPAEPGVVAVEPSWTMLRQRAGDAAPAVRAVAERLPFATQSFDAALAILTTHHWSDAAAGLGEMRRVARRQVVVTWDPGVFARQFWLVRDFVPEAVAREESLATLATVAAHLPGARIEPLPVPAACVDGFFGAYWRRPHAYLDPAVRGAISGLALLDERIVTVAFQRLRDDLDSGTWQARNAELLALDEIDLGYRLVIADATRAVPTPE